MLWCDCKEIISIEAIICDIRKEYTTTIVEYIKCCGRNKKKFNKICNIR